MFRFQPRAPLDATTYPEPPVGDRSGVPLTRGFLFTLVSTVAADACSPEALAGLSRVNPDAWYQGPLLETILGQSPEVNAMSTPHRRAFTKIAVYCGSSSGSAPHYLEAARELGAFLGRRGIDVVYGGGRVGLMGAVADAALEAGGRVYGVIPERLATVERAHRGLTELFVVDGMHTRKMKMASMADAFLALPGGWGTLEEVFEAVTWAQLQYHDKPVGLLNVRGYFDHLLAFLDHAVAEGFIGPMYRPLLASTDDVEALLDRMATLEIPAGDR